MVRTTDHLTYIMSSESSSRSAVNIYIRPVKPKAHILPIIVISQFCCTSLWFASNGIMTELISYFDLQERALGDLTSFVQFGFIAGTLVFAILMIADRHPPSKVFLICGFLGAVANFLLILDFHTIGSLLLLRFATGFFLAGIYPVGMRIAADYYDSGLGKSLGYLVGALVLGTAFPHLIKGSIDQIAWQAVIISISILASIGGLLIYLLVPTGPYNKQGQHVDFAAFASVFKSRNFRSAAFGYFGHMWELYAFWAFVPVILSTYQNFNSMTTLNLPMLSFLIIGIGFMSCIISGYLSLRFGTKRVAIVALSLSCLCCVISPLAFQLENVSLFVVFLIFWGAVVIADSPLFSTLVAQNAQAEIKGTALTIVNCIGFAITIISIQLLTSLNGRFELEYLLTILAIGPILGLIALAKKQSKQAIR